MKRDLSLVREILQALADARHPLDASLFIDDRHDFQDVAYHFKIMEQGGLIKASILYAEFEYQSE